MTENETTPPRAITHCFQPTPNAKRLQRLSSSSLLSIPKVTWYVKIVTTHSTAAQLTMLRFEAVMP